MPRKPKSSTKKPGHKKGHKKVKIVQDDRISDSEDYEEYLETGEAAYGNTENMGDVVDDKEYEDDEMENDDKMSDDMEIDDEDKDMDDEDGEYEAPDEDDDEEEHVDETDVGKMYKYARKKTDFSDEEDDEDDIYDILDDDKQNQSNVLTGDDRITKAVLTKYERVRLLEDRTKQLSLGAKPMIKNVEDLPSRKVAELELKYNVIPLIIIRPLPNNLMEKWKISELAH